MLNKARVAAQPEASFPEIAGDPSELEAFYRFMSNEHVTPQAILAPHIEASVNRAARHADVVVAHDTTHCHFEGEREGLGRLNQKNHGFWAHVALATSVRREVFGVVGLRYGTRHGPAKWRGPRRIVGDDVALESVRWPELVTEVGARFEAGSVIHVMDREADWFALFEHLVSGKHRFVIRMSHDRLVEPKLRVSDVLAGASVLAERDVQLSARARSGSPKDRAKHPPRKLRSARLEIKSSTATVVSSTSSGKLPLNLVRVQESEPPDGCEPVVWTLVTTEPVATAEQVLAVVDAYRARWVIEEFFKALKTGCAFEKRQLGSYAALLNALAVSLPIAAFLMRLRDAGRHRPERPAREVIDRELLTILAQLVRRPMPERPTVRDVMYAIAGLGGHLARNGDPGWMTLSRGHEHLLEAAYVLRRITRSDQS
jgi:hypothetical protein